MTFKGLSVEPDRQCVYLDLTHIPRSELDRKLGGIMEIYEKFQGVDPREVPMKIFPAVHYSMGGLWADYERTEQGGLMPGSPRNQVTNIPGLYAIGECDYQYHGGNRLGANSLLSCIFAGLFVAPCLKNLFTSSTRAPAADEPSSLYDGARQHHQDTFDGLLNRSGGGENPYLIHQDVGNIMTKAATVVRRNDQLDDAYEKVSELAERARSCSLSDTGKWTNQNVVFTRALMDMFPLAKTILRGARQRDECRGAHFKPDFAMPGVEAEDPGERRRLAEAWCDRFEEKNQRWLKSTVARWDSDNYEADISYEDVDTSLIPPRPRLYGLVGAEVIEEAWNERASRQPGANGDAAATASSQAKASV